MRLCLQTAKGKIMAGKVQKAIEEIIAEIKDV
jgi:hypothetical protein